MTTTHLFRGNASGEILDADGKVAGRIVPVEPTEDQVIAGTESVIGSFESDKPSPILAYCAYLEMLSAAPTDWSEHAVRVPEREEIPRWKCCDIERALGFNEALDAIMEAK